LSHSQIVEDQASVTRDLAHFLRDVAGSTRFDHAHGEAPNPGHVFQAVAGADATAIFVIISVDDVVAAVLDGPMPPVHLEDALGIGADVLTFDIDPIQQGDGYLDLVGLFGLITAFDGQGSLLLGCSRSGSDDRRHS
jgi:hypothetical protein